ncbi:MAG: response regulator transcription factor [Flavobacterium sp.]|nr:response regulator transcription factor [Flavobacterium sp.]
MEEKIKIIIADDEVLFQQGISFILSREKNIEICKEVNDGKQLMDFLNSIDDLPDIILMDLKMPFINGVEATKLISTKFPTIKIIALTSYNTDSFIANMIHVGAVSYLVKNATPAEMIETINEVYQKGFYYNESVLKVINDGLISTSNKSKLIKSVFSEDYLTNREKEILKLICLQYSTAEIAEKIFISPRTVEGHRNSLLLKTESRNVAGLVVFAIQNKVIDFDELSL